MKIRPKYLDPLAEAPFSERSLRELYYPFKWIMLIMLIAFSAFQLYTGITGQLPRNQQMAVHLMFALGLVFLMFPPLKRWGNKKWTIFIDLFFSLLGISVALYIVLLHDVIATRASDNTTLDYIVGASAILLVLEATRRCVSPVLVWITVIFLIYALVGANGFIPLEWDHPRWLPNWIPDLQHTGVRLTSLITTSYLVDTGIFATPLAVSASFVFLFVLFGASLERSGGGRYLIDLAFSVMGRFRGGPAKSSVMASALMGTMSGSSIANTVSTGSLTIPLMKKSGFRPHIAGAVEVAASTNGQLMPPVMGAAAFLIVEYTRIGYNQVIIAAAIPALLSYMAIFTMIHLEAVRQGINPLRKEEMKKLSKVLLKGLTLNIPLVGLVVMLVVLQYTANTSAAAAVTITLGLYTLTALFSPLAIYGVERVKGRGFPFRGRLLVFNVLGAFRDAAMNMVPIAVACACCGLIIGVVGRTGLGPNISTLIEDISQGQILIALFLTAITCLVMGVGLPTTATYVIMATLVAPAIMEIAYGTGDISSVKAEYGIAAVLAVHIFVFYYGILADDTPPVGLCAYAAAGISGADPIRTGFASFRFDLAAFSLPFIFFFNQDLLLIGANYWKLAYELPASIIGILCFAAALQGYTWRPTGWTGRLILMGTSLALIWPHPISLIVAVALALSYLAWDRWVIRPQQLDQITQIPEKK